MFNQLADNICNMRNDEIIGLAKNRFLPAEVMMAIAKFHYRRAHMYLCENKGLDKKTRDYLWSDACNRGYSNKCELLLHGHYRDEPEKYLELYNSHGNQMYSRSPWRANSCFIRGGWYNDTRSYTPAELLNRIYDERFAGKGILGPSSHSYYSHNLGYALRDMAQHVNCDLPLAIKLSTCGKPEVEKLAFQKIVELSK